MVETFVKMVDDSRRRLAVNEGDYQVDGLWWCGACNTPKQVEVTVNDILYKPMCLCRCGVERLRKDQEDYEDREKKREIASAKLSCFPDLRMSGYTFDTDNGNNYRIMNAMRRYAAKFAGFLRTGQGIILYGSYSTGKTFAACAVANELLDKGYRVKVTTLTAIVNRMQERWEGRNEYLQSLNEYDLLILDDLGVERQSDYMSEQVFAVIDGRYRSGKPMIITTNLRLEDMDGTGNDGRIYSRIKEKCIPIEVNDYNFRKDGMQENYRMMKKELFWE